MRDLEACIGGAQLRVTPRAPRKSRACIMYRMATSLVHLLVAPSVRSSMTQLPAHIQDGHDSLCVLSVFLSCKPLKAMDTRQLFRWVLWGGDSNAAHSVQSTEYINVLSQQCEFQNPPSPPSLGVAQPRGWSDDPPIIHTNIDHTLAIGPWPIIEPPQCRNLPQSHGGTNTGATNEQDVLVVGYSKGQGGNTISQAMAAMHRAAARGFEPSEPDLTQFLHHETGSYTCLCVDGGPCSKIFERRHRAIDHVRGHFGLRAYPCRGHCGKPKWWVY
jgi:hypothetical protein